MFVKSFFHIYIDKMRKMRYSIDINFQFYRERNKFI